MVRELQYRGAFYPEESVDIEDFINNNIRVINKIDGLKGIIVPHAGWIYSGYTAAKGFSHTPNRNIKRVYLIGPSHRYHFRGVALSSYTEYETPHGKMVIDKQSEKELLSIPGVGIVDEAHIYEHALEVELGFIEKLYPDTKLVPIVAGGNSEKTLTRILDKTLNEEDSFTIISSDLSHFKSYKDAKTIDDKSIKMLTTGNGALDSQNACGAVILNSLLEIIKTTNLELDLIDYTNSGDTAGDKDSVVGYCSMEIIACG